MTPVTSFESRHVGTLPGRWVTPLGRRASGSPYSGVSETSQGVGGRKPPGTRAMKGFGKIALVFSLLGGLMAYFIIPVQFSRKRALSPTDKAEYALTVDYYKRHCGPVIEEIEERARAYAREGEEEIWTGYDAMLQNRGLVIGSPAWCRYMGALWFK